MHKDQENLFYIFTHLKIPLRISEFLKIFSKKNKKYKRFFEFFRKIL